MHGQSLRIEKMIVCVMCVCVCITSFPPSNREASCEQSLCPSLPIVLAPSIWLSAEHRDSSSGVFESRKESTTFHGLFLSLNIKCHGAVFFLFTVAGSRVYGFGDR